MTNSRKRTLIAAATGSVATLALVGALLVPVIASAQDTTPAVPTTPDATTAPYGNRFGGWHGDGTALAEALGITVEELDAAHIAAGEAAIDAAVEQGVLTEEQAELMRSHGIEGRAYGPVRGAEIDVEALLADALGITVEELEAAQETALEANLAAAVEAGDLTQEEADLRIAAHGLREYMGDRLQTAWDDALAAAIADGVITQEQADQLGAGNGMGFGFGMFGRGDGPFGGRGMRGHHSGMGFNMGQMGQMGQMRGMGMMGQMGGMGQMGVMGQMGGMRGHGMMDGTCDGDCVPMFDGTGQQYGGRGPRG